MNSPWYFELLALEPTSDQRAIKRAYAAALKRIDQETQAEEFARLRRAYELAQQWHDDDELDKADEEAEENPVLAEEGLQPLVAEGSAAPGITPALVSYAAPLERPASESELLAGTDETEPEVPDASPSAIEYASPPARPFAIDIGALDEVFGRFIEKANHNPATAAASLEEALKADALISLGAREAFESRLVSWLYRKEQPHWGALFEAAAIQFDWAHRILTKDGAVKSWLDLRVRQWSHWLGESAQWRARVMQAVASANAERIEKAPRDELLAMQAALNSACDRYPQWMLLHLAPERLHHWSTRVAELTRPTYWQRVMARRVHGQGSRNANLVALFVAGLILSLLVAVVARFNEHERRVSGPNAPPALSRPLVSFKPSARLCIERAKLGGHWAQLYDNELTYRSFKNELIGCVDAKLWPEEQMSSQEYLRRLKHAWHNADDPNNASMVGREPGIGGNATRASSLACVNTWADPSTDPVGADCVALAGTYFQERVNSFPVSPEFCSQRAASAGGWNFDKGREWINYLGFRQEVADCLAKDWWPGGLDSAEAHVQQMIEYWRMRYPQMITHIQALAASEPEVAKPGGSTLTVGPGGRLVIGADGVQISGNVRINGKPVSPDADVPPVDGE